MQRSRRVTTCVHEDRRFRAIMDAGRRIARRPRALAYRPMIVGVLFVASCVFSLTMFVPAPATAQDATPTEVTEQPTETPTTVTTVTPTVVVEPFTPTPEPTEDTQDGTSTDGITETPVQATPTPQPTEEFFEVTATSTPTDPTPVGTPTALPASPTPTVEPDSVVVRARSAETSAIPGQTVDQSFHVRNTSSHDVTVRLTVTTSARGWEAIMLTGSGDAPQPEIVTIPAATEIEVIVRVTVPPDAYRGDQNRTSLDATVIASPSS